jgi:two-component system, NtrC family, sensor kinase
MNTLIKSKQAKDVSKILIVDDQQLIHKDFRKILSHDQSENELDELETKLLGSSPQRTIQLPKYQIDSAFQGEEALEMVKRAHAENIPYEVVFVDMRMPPGWDGLTTIKHLWEVDKDIQVVICSAYSDCSWQQIITELGVSDRLLILKKPFDNIEIIQIAHNLTEKWKLVRLSKLKIDEMEKIIQERAAKNLEMQKQVFMATKLASIGELAAGVAHEINNPLAIIRGNIELLLLEQQVQQNNAIKAPLERANQCVDRIKNIVNGLRTYARSDTEHLEKINIHEIIDNTISLVGSIYDKDRISFDRRINAERKHVLGNVGRFQQVLMNLFSNARDAMQGKIGKIIVDTSNRDNQVFLRITDTGSGIKQEYLSRIFDPFFTTKDVGKGTGLGLGIVQSIVEMMKGKIYVESEEGIGTSFAMSFPCADGNVIENNNELQKEHSFKGKVLVVEDEENLRQLLVDNLKKTGLEVLDVADGSKALECCRQQQFDLILTDIKMPFMDGLNLLKAIKPLQKAKIIVVTGGIVTEFSKEDRNNLRSLTDAYLKKPFARGELYQALEKVLKK